MLIGQFFIRFETVTIYTTNRHLKPTFKHNIQMNNCNYISKKITKNIINNIKSVDTYIYVRYTRFINKREVNFLKRSDKHQEQPDREEEMKLLTSIFQLLTAVLTFINILLTIIARL